MVKLMAPMPFEFFCTYTFRSERIYCIAQFIDWEKYLRVGLIQIFDGKNIDRWHLDNVC